MKAGRRWMWPALCGAAISMSAATARADDPPKTPALPVSGAPVVIADPMRAWEPGMPPPPAYRVGSEVCWPFVVSGSALAGTGWLVNVWFGVPMSVVRDGSDANRDMAKKSMVPLVGPFIALATYTERNDGMRAMLLATGLSQVVGLGLLTVGLAWRTPVLEPGPARASTGFVMPVPIALPDGLGLGLAGTM